MGISYPELLQTPISVVVHDLEFMTYEHNIQAAKASQ
jgi:hypothetical protein